MTPKEKSQVVNFNSISKQIENIINKTAFQYIAYRPLADGIPLHPMAGGLVPNSALLSTHPPPPIMERQTPVKTFPSRNFVGEP